MKKILITSALPYINGIKHLGNLIGSQLPADVYARYMRARGNKVLFICATDEHGTPELAAIEKKKQLKNFVKKCGTFKKILLMVFLFLLITSAVHQANKIMNSPTLRY